METRLLYLRLLVLDPGEREGMGMWMSHTSASLSTGFGFANAERGICNLATLTMPAEN